jgi:predicted RNA-binding protein
MDKNILKYGLYILISIIVLIILYNVWSFNTDLIVENFDVDKEILKLTESYKYNLLHIPDDEPMSESNNIYSIKLNTNKFIKQIFIIVEDESSISRNIPLDLQIIVKNGDVEKYVNMSKYKLITDSSSGNFYSGKSMNFTNLTDLTGELLRGDTIILKSDTYKFKLANIYIFGNNTGVDYVPMGGERDITQSINIDEDTGNISVLTPYLISKVEFIPIIEGFEDIEDFKIGRRFKRFIKKIKRGARKHRRARSKIKKYKKSYNYSINDSTSLMDDILNIIKYYKSQLNIIRLKKIGDRNVKKDTLRRLDKELEIIKNKITTQLFNSINDAKKTEINNNVIKLIDKVNVDYLGNKIQGKLSARAKLLSKNEWNNHKRYVLDPLLDINNGKLKLLYNEFINEPKIIADTTESKIDEESTDELSSSTKGTIDFSISSFENVEGFTDLKYNSDEIILTPYILTYYFEKPILIMNDLTNLSINISNYRINKIYGKPASSNDINEFKFSNGLISFRDSLNPDTIVGDKAILDKVKTSMEILDVLDYQKKINAQLKQLDLNKHNIRDLYNQKIDIINTIKKIDRISNNYLKQIQDADEYNAKKFTETIDILQYLKSELEKQERLQKTRFDINLHL